MVAELIISLQLSVKIYSIKVLLRILPFPIIKATCMLFKCEKQQEDVWFVTFSTYLPVSNHGEQLHVLYITWLCKLFDLCNIIFTDVFVSELFVFISYWILDKYAMKERSYRNPKPYLWKSLYLNHCVCGTPAFWEDVLLTITFYQCISELDFLLKETLANYY